MSQDEIIEDEPKKGNLGVAIVWYVIAQAIMFGYFFGINNALMKVQGLKYCYLGCFWPFTSGG